MSARLIHRSVLTFDDPERSLGQGEDDEGNSLPHIMHHSKLPPGILPHGLPMVQEVAPALTPGEQRERKEQEQQPQKESKSFVFPLNSTKTLC